MKFCKGAMRRYFYNWLCWADIGLNVFFGGDYRETCSSRLGRYQGKGQPAARKIASWVDWVALHVFGQPNHCQASIQPNCDTTAEVLK